MKWCSTTSRPASTSTRCGHLRLVRCGLPQPRGCSALQYEDALCKPMPTHTPRGMVRCTCPYIPTACPKCPPCERLIFLALRPSHFLSPVLLLVFSPSSMLIDENGATGLFGRLLQVNFRKNVTFEEPSGRPGCDFIGVNHYARCSPPHFSLFGRVHCRQHL